MLKNWPKITTTALSVGIGVLFITTTSFASSKYVIKQTQTIPRTAYHITNSNKTLFTWNKNHTKRLRILNQLDTKKQKMSWWADEKVEMEHNGKTSTYLHLESEYGSAGYVYAKAMTQGYSKGYSSDAAYFCYYQLNHTLKVPLSSKGFVNLPKGTVVQGALDVFHGQESLQINGNALSYNLRKKLKLTNSQTFKSIKFDASGATPIKQPAYNTVKHNNFADVRASNLFMGTPETSDKKQLFRTTSDGYVEYYKNDNANIQDKDLPVGQPEYQKILASKTVDGMTTILYRHHIKGLKDTPTTVDGTNGYQLTLKSQKKTTVCKDDVYNTYLIGGEPFFSYEGYNSLPVTATQINSKELTELSKDAPKIAYYRLRKKITVSAPFEVYVSGTLNQKISLPKGTVVSGNITTNGKYQKVMNIDTSRLNKNILKSGYQRGLYAGTEQATTRNIGAFTRIARPNYMPKYNCTGNLYLGNKKDIISSKISKQSMQITTNGYLEVRTNDVDGSDAEYRAKPNQSLKIKRVIIKGHTRYLYVSEKISGLKMTKVTYKGKKQYKLALTNPQKTFAADFDPEGDEDSSPSYYGLLNLGGKTFYTNYNI